ncbi:hypothetical protein WH158_15300 [Gluconobacter cerinus]|uniref:hypothetical protein n=1 Tax=Gluconobacter cerinus TaxID=38307 RepID=UPI0030A07472
MLFPTRNTLQVSDMAVDLTAASMTIGRLDQRLQDHPLKEAFLYRARLDAVRVQAQVDGQAIDPWHLAAVLEGLRLPTQNLEGADRFALVEAAQTAFRLYPSVSDTTARDCTGSLSSPAFHPNVWTPPRCGDRVP